MTGRTEHTEHNQWHQWHQWQTRWIDRARDFCMPTLGISVIVAIPIICGLAYLGYELASFKTYLGERLFPSKYRVVQVGDEHQSVKSQVSGLDEDDGSSASSAPARSNLPTTPARPTLPTTPAFISISLNNDQWETLEKFCKQLNITGVPLLEKGKINIEISKLVEIKSEMYKFLLNFKVPYFETTTERAIEYWSIKKLYNECIGPSTCQG